MKITNIIHKAGHWFSELTVGGSWGKTQPSAVQRNLHWFWIDGLFSSAHDNIYANYISLYILVLGATQAQVGLMSSFSNLAAALLLLPGAFIAERYINKHKVALFFIGGLARFSILLLVFVPIFIKGPGVIWAAILFSVLRDSFANLGYPAWMAVTHEIVPIDGRGRYFGSRNFIMNIAGILVTLLTGKLITLFIGQLGYQIALGVAFVFGVSSAISYAHIKPDYSVQEENSRLSFKQLINALRDQKSFLMLVLSAAIWNYAINVSGPFFNVHMLQKLHFNASEIGFLNVITVLSMLLVQNKLGSLSDRLGPRKLQLFSMVLIPVLPIGWIFVTRVWHIAILNIFNGILWGAYNLSSFNLLLASMPKNQISHYSAVYQVVIALSLALGAMTGSALISTWTFAGLLIASVVFRVAATVVFAKFVPDSDKGRST